MIPVSTLRKSTSSPLAVRRFLAGFAMAAMIFLGLGASACAIDNNATQQIWKLKYGVTNAQLADSVWLDQDSDGDGVKNKDEIAAGTNPFVASNTIKVTGLVKVGSNVNVSFPSEAGKLYRVERTATLGSGWTIQAGQLIGDGSVKTLTVGYVANNFYRVRVDDTDSDGDRVADWAETAVGLNPSVAETISGMSTLAYVNAQIALPNVVTIAAAEPFASEDGPQSGKFTVTRTQNLFAITVNYGVTGTAVVGVDYASVGTSVAFVARGATSADIFVNPTVQAPLIKGGRSVTVALSGPGAAAFPFTLGAPNTATVIINSSTAPTGTGLLGRYYDTAGTTYADAANFGQSGTYTYTRLKIGRAHV